MEFQPESKLYIFASRFLAVIIVATAMLLPIYLAGCGGDGGDATVTIENAVPPISCDAVFINNADGTQTAGQNCIDGNGNRVESPGDNSSSADTTTTDTDTTSGDTTTTTTNPAGAAG